MLVYMKFQLLSRTAIHAFHACHLLNASGDDFSCTNTHQKVIQDQYPTSENESSHYADVPIKSTLAMAMKLKNTFNGADQYKRPDIYNCNWCTIMYTQTTLIDHLGCPLFHHPIRTLSSCGTSVAQPINDTVGLQNAYSSQCGEAHAWKLKKFECRPAEGRITKGIATNGIYIYTYVINQQEPIQT